MGSNKQLMVVSLRNNFVLRKTFTHLSLINLVRDYSYTNVELFSRNPGSWLSGEESACQFRRCEFNSWPGRSPGGGNGNLLQYFCLENPMERGAWQFAIYGITKSQTWLRRSRNPGSEEVTCFPNVNKPMLTTVICLIDQPLVYIFGVFTDTKTYSKLWLKNTDLEVLFFFFKNYQISK